MTRWRRILKRLLLGLLGVVVLVVGITLLALANLDARPMKGWVRGAAQAQGIVLDYDVGKVTFGGLRFARLRVASPAVDVALAPDLVSIGSIEGRWSPFSKRLDTLVIRDVALTIVRNPDGSTSLDRFLAGLPASEEPPPEPLSVLSRALVPLGLEAHARIEGVTITIIDRADVATAGGGPVLERGTAAHKIVVTGLTAKADLVDGALAFTLGPTALRLTMPGPPSASAQERELVIDLRGSATLAASGRGSLALDATLQKQTLVPMPAPAKQLLSLAATVDFDAAQKRTRLTVERLSLLDSAATLTAQAELRDIEVGGIPRIRPWLEQAVLRVDLARVARAVPPMLVPVEAEGEPIVVTVSKAAIDPVWQGVVTVKGELARARWRQIEVHGLGLAIEARPVDGGFRAEIKVPVAALTMPGLALSGVEFAVEAEHREPARGGASGPASLWPLHVNTRASVASAIAPTQTVRGLAVTATATARSAQALDAEVAVTLASLAGAATVQGLQMQASVREWTLGQPALHSTGTVAVKGTVDSARDGSGKRVSKLAFAVDAALAGAAPARAAVKVDAGNLVIPGLARSLGPSFAGGPLHVELQAPTIELDVTAPANSRADAKLAARYGGASIEGTVAGSMAQVAWKLAMRAPRLGPAQNVAVNSNGSFVVATGRIAHDTTIDVGRVATAAAALRGARLHAVSNGTAVQHEAKISAALDSVSSGGKSLGSPKLELVAKVDRLRPSMDVRLSGSQPTSDLRVTAEIDAARTVRWQAKGRVAGLAALAPFLPTGPNWERLSVEIDGRGAAAGVISSVRAGTPVLVRDPATNARGRQSLTLVLRDLHYLDQALTSADIAALTIKADVDLADTRTANIDLAVPELAAVSKGVKLGAEALAVRLEASLAKPGNIDAKLTVRAASARQTVLPWYAIRAPELTLTVTGDPSATLALAMQVRNPGAGTVFEVAGDLERNVATSRLGAASGIISRNSLSLDGRLEQSLDGMAAAPKTLQARGRISMPFRIESGDLSLFRTSARVTLDNVDLDLPAAKVRLVKVNGELPVVQEFVITAAGIERVGQGERGLFSQLRFPDYKPFTAAGDYLSIGEISVRGASFGPLAGNARVDRDVVALDQLELSALGGKITGQCLAELRGPDTRLAFRGKLTGLQPSINVGAASGDKLDANAAITITPYRYGLDGRTEIVRIGRDHLRALLNLWDPFGSDVAANRVRLALKVGYPEQVRLHFASGFASLAIELGGLAGVVRIDEIRGIPIGPALAHFLAPFLEQP